ncbi:MAG TPA: RibD family protein [Thermoleophilia bacterium]|nr:RibD family protein [Thermoleophilia bacterium]
MPRPYVVLHNEVSLDGRFDHLNPDLGRFYALARRWREDATLVGADTILAMEDELAQEEAAADSPEEAAADSPEESADLPFLVVVDSRGRIQRWRELRDQPYWGRSLVLCSERTPSDYRTMLADLGIEVVVAGEERVDLVLALEELSRRYDIQTVRVDSGGILNGALLRADLVDEISVLLEPRLVGGDTPRSLFHAADVSSAQELVELRLVAMEAFEDDVVWMRYLVIR